MAKQIKLTREKIALVDDEEFYRVDMFRWHAKKGRKTWYAQRWFGKRPFRKNVFLHNFLMNTPEGYEVDHIDGNGLNNQLSNLRLATPSQNRFNQGLNITNTSGYKGVYWRKDRNYWSMNIKVNGRKFTKDGFLAPEDAARAYDEMAIKLHGEFAHLNFPR